MTCWTCAYQNRNSPATFLGLCTFPAANNPDKNKPIPPEFVDKGCKNWKEREEKE